MPGLQDKISPADDAESCAWALSQAEALRAMAQERGTVPLDLETLAQEIAGLARSERDVLFAGGFSGR